MSSETMAHSIGNVCELTGLSRMSIYKAIHDGKLLVRKLGKRSLVLDPDLRRVLEGLPIGPDNAFRPRRKKVA
jgi:excisionase family DNA binding protein